MSRQYAFDLAAPPTYRAEDFFRSASNAVAWTQVMQAPWPNGRMLLIGAEGVGKSHLAHVWAESAGAGIIAARDLGRADLGRIAGALVVEDAPALAGDAAGEEALFHLWNRAGPLLVTAALPPRDWRLTLPDLASRVQAMAQASIDPPDDTLLAAVLVKLFADRQVHVQPGLIAYLAARMERSLAAARRLVDELDRRALSHGGPVTRALAAAVVGGGASDLDSRADE
ncbi:MAG: chromosomal replication initiator DnaA [Paracoccaceae bacterium]